MAQITITFNYGNRTCNFSPNTLQVPYNANADITWKLVVTGNVPSGTTVKFPPTGGIVFAPGWPGSTPTIDPNDPTKYTATDDNDSSNTLGDWKYTTSIEIDTANSGGLISFDPDVQNEGPPMISRK
jgi:hypothetical protein